MSSVLKVYDENTSTWVDIPSIQGEKGDTGTAAGFGTPTVSVDSTTGTPSATVTASGEDTAKVFSFAFSGLKGAKGDDGTTPSTAVTTITGGHNVAFNYGTGDPRNTNFDVMDGQDGSGIPAGGTTGQVLKKSSGTDYAVEWANESGLVTSVDGKTGAVTVLPSGGTQGQVLQKSSSTDYAVEWADQSGGMVVHYNTSATPSVDKTYNEIYTAITNNQYVELIDTRNSPTTSSYQLYYCTSSYISFVRYNVESTNVWKYTVSIYSDNSVTSGYNAMSKDTVYDNTWYLNVWENSPGQYSMTDTTTSNPGPYTCLASSHGVIYLKSNVYLENVGDQFDIAEPFPCVNTTIGEVYNENYGEYYPTGTFYFEKIKNISGIDTRCQFVIYVPNLYNGWTDATITYSTTPILQSESVFNITLASASWSAVSGATDVYQQTVTISNGTANTKIDLQPDYSVVQQMTNDGAVNLYVANNNGTFTAYVVGAALTANVTVQASRTETV